MSKILSMGEASTNQPGGIMSRSTTPSSNVVHHGVGACAQAPSAAPASEPRAKFYARVVAQLMHLLSQMAGR